jgi:hypothetical protein
MTAPVSSIPRSLNILVADPEPVSGGPGKTLELFDVLTQVWARFKASKDPRAPWRPARTAPCRLLR